MALYRRKDSRFWWVKFTGPDGTRIYRSAKTENKRQAEEYEAALKTEIWRAAQMGEQEAPRHKWQDAVVRWVRESEKKTLDDDISHLRAADPILGGLYLDEISRDTIDRLILLRQDAGVSNATINRLLEVVRAILRKARDEWGWVETIPKFRRLKEPQTRIRWLTREEADAVLSFLPEHIARMMRFTLATGLRESNVTGLTWEQVDLSRRVAWIHADQSKTGEPIGVPLNRDAVVVLRECEGDHSTRVFTFNGRPVKKAGTRAWRIALDKAKIRPFYPPPSMKTKHPGLMKFPLYPIHEYKFENFRWHDLRHTWASWHVMAGTPLNVLKELGGWSSLDMVLRYGHLAPEHLADAAENITGLRAVAVESREKRQ